MAPQADLDRLSEFKDVAAIVGVGDTDYLADYRTPLGEAAAVGSGGGDSYVLAARAFRRALDDAGLDKSEIDGLCVGGPMSHERTSEVLGLNPRWSSSGDAPRSVIEAVQAIKAGLCTTVACVYGNAQRSQNVQYGGPQAMGGGGILSYVYYAPWGLTSQGALYSLMFKRHQLVYGTTEEQLAAIPVALRKHATLNPNAIMRERPMTTDDYLNARYIVEPLRLFDYCLVNDGGVALIVQRADLARERRQEPVLVSGFGWSELSVDATQLRPRIKDFYFPAHRDVVEQVYPMAGVTQRDIDVYATYDSFSVHLLFTLEGFGFCGEGESGAFIQDGRIEVGGELPCNTSGGMLSESYMQSWNHQVELVRQLRGGLGDRRGRGAPGRAGGQRHGARRWRDRAAAAPLLRLQARPRRRPRPQHGRHGRLQPARLPGARRLGLAGRVGASAGGARPAGPGLPLPGAALRRPDGRRVGRAPRDRVQLPLRRPRDAGAGAAAALRPPGAARGLRGGTARDR